MWLKVSDATMWSRFAVLTIWSKAIKEVQKILY
jgi:hypothetical protein